MSDELTMEQRLREMSLIDYIVSFGSVTDQDADNETFKQRVPFALWPRQAEACDFMENTQAVLLPKSRQKGYSELSAERCLKTLFEHKNTKGAVVSKSEDFAKAYLIDRILPKYKYMSENHPGMFPKILKQTKEEIEFEGGRKLLSISCSNTGAASLTLDFMVFDEAGGIDEGRGKMGENDSLFKSILDNSLPALDQNPQSWAMIIGTSVPGSYYNQLVREAYENGNTGEYKYFFIGWYHQPGRNREWYLRQKARLKENVYLQHPTDMEDFFYVKDGLVFPHFDPREGGRHVVPFEIGKVIHRKVKKGLKSEIQRFRPSWSCQFKTAYDHGTNHPAVELYTLYDEYNDMLFVFDELFYQDGHGTQVEDILKDMRRKAIEFPFPRKPDKELCDGAIFNDVGAKSIGSMFIDGGRRFIKASKHDEAASRELLNGRFRDDKIIIHPRCVNFIRQIRSYRWDAKAKGEKPIQKDDDAIDAGRYICVDCRPEDHERTERMPDSYKVDWNRRGLESGEAQVLEINDDWMGY